MDDQAQLWKDMYESKERDFKELQNTYKEFQQSSHEFENELEEELAQAQVECDRMKSRLSKTEAQLRKSRDECDRLRRQSNEEVANLQEKLQESAGDSHAQESLLRIQKLMAEKNELEKQFRDELGDLQEQLDSANERCELLDTEVEEMKAAHDEEVAQYRDEIRRLKSDMVGDSSGGGGVNDARVQDLINSLKDDIEDLKEKNEVLMLDKDQLEARLLEESELNEELTGEVSDLTDDFMANSDKIEELEKLIAEQKEQIQKLEAAPPAASKPKDRKASIEAAEKVLALQAAMEELKDDNSRLQGQLAAQTEINDRMAKEVKTLSKENIANAAKLADLGSAAGSEQVKVADLERRIKTLKEELAEAKEQLNDAEQQVAEADARAKAAEDTVHNQASSGLSAQQVILREKDLLESKYEELEFDFRKVKDELDNLKREKAALVMDKEKELRLKQKIREEKAAVASKRLNDTLGKTLKKFPALGLLTSSLGGLRGSMNGMSADVTDTQSFFRESFSKLSVSVGQLGKIVKSAQANYAAVMKEKTKIFDSLQDMKGNIRVFCRVRPLLPHEVKAKVVDCVEFPGENQVALVKKGAATQAKTFTFDRVYSPTADQKEIFQDCEKLVQSTLDGYNVCIFAYGQTGSGKTYTMEGPTSNPGVNLRAMKALFRQIKSLAPQYMFEVKVSFVEIYNERLTDLLDSEAVKGLKLEDMTSDVKDDSNDRLQIRKGAHGMYVTNLTSYGVNSPDEIIDLIKTGAKNRTVFATNANAHSSRSHSILVVSVDGTDQVTMNKTHGKLYLVDLAGSERVKHTDSSGQRLVEATYINKSLSALGDVMNALSTAKKGSHIPYRNSKLTYLLQDSLGGNSKTMMFVNLSVNDQHAQETLCSLQFAKRVRKVKLNAQAKVEHSAVTKYRSKIEDITSEKQTLQSKLKAAQEKYEKRMAEKEDIIHDLTEQLKKNMSEVHRVELQKKKELAEMAQEQSRLAKMASSAKDKSALERQKQKYKELHEKYDHMQSLLKHSQRENKTIKAKLEKAGKAMPAKKKTGTGDSAKAMDLEKKYDKMARKARVEALARQRLEEEGEASVQKLQKKLDDKDQMIRVLRSKNKKLHSEISNLKHDIKKAQVRSFYKSQSKKNLSSKKYTSIGSDNASPGYEDSDVSVSSVRTKRKKRLDKARAKVEKARADLGSPSNSSASRKPKGFNLY